VTATPVYRIALDVMGGDHAPHATLEGAGIALRAHPGLHLLLVGDESKLVPLMGHFGITGDLLRRAEIVHAPSVVTMEDKATSILKEKKDSSIRIAAQLVRDGKADGVVSMGNTGAAMVASKLVIGSLEGVDRPCLAMAMPNTKGRPTVLLDVGANVDSKPEHLAQFALMGSVYAEQVLGLPRPKVGLLSVGEEEAKGNGTIKSAALMLKELDLNFAGNAEGRDIWNGQFDVIACDGFVGNAILKASESLAEGIVKGLRDSINQSWLSRLGGLLAKPAIRRFMKKLDYTEYGGAPLLGVKGVSIIGHGRSNGRAVASAIRIALLAADHRLNERIHEALTHIQATAGGEIR
jgi:glycerol-3-phosphate acyltransferase PlsX